MAFSRSKTISLVRSRFSQWEVSTLFEPIYEYQQRTFDFVNNSLNFVHQAAKQLTPIALCRQEHFERAPSAPKQQKYHTDEVKAATVSMTNECTVQAVFRRRKNRRNRINYIFFGSNLSQNIMVSVYVTLLQFFMREQMTHLGPHLGGGLAPLDLSVREGDR